MARIRVNPSYRGKRIKRPATSRRTRLPLVSRLMRLRPNKASSTALMFIGDAEQHIVGINSVGNYNGSKKYFQLINKYKVWLFFFWFHNTDIAFNSQLYLGSIGQNAAALQPAKLVLVLIEPPIRFNISNGTAGCSCRSLFNSYPELGGTTQIWFSWLFPVLCKLIPRHSAPVRHRLFTKSARRNGCVWNRL